MSTIHQTYPALASLERSPFSAILGLKVETASVGAAVVRMPFDLRLLNDGGPDVPIHGGAIASLADFAACAAVWTMPETLAGRSSPTRWSLTKSHDGILAGGQFVCTRPVHHWLAVVALDAMRGFNSIC
jgi:acyl-coenzyme A thioesterase PaaI-like protein